MAKASTMFWLFDNNVTYQYVQATYDFVQRFASIYNIDKQTVYNYIKDQPLINISYDYYAPSYMDAFAKALGIKNTERVFVTMKKIVKAGINTIELLYGFVGCVVYPYIQTRGRFCCLKKAD